MASSAAMVLPASCWRAKQDILVSVVQSVEDLRLHRIEKAETRRIDLFQQGTSSAQ